MPGGPGLFPVSQRPLSSWSPIFTPSLSVPVPGWGGGRGTLLGINFTLWILLLSCLLPQEKAQPWDPQLCSSVSDSLLLVLTHCDGVQLGGGEGWPGL